LERTPLPAPVVIEHRSNLPVLLSIPHSGRTYPDWLVSSAASGLRSLVGLEDPLVDRLAWRAIASGHGAVIATAARAAIDCNRAPDEIDPSLIAGAASSIPSRRAAAGLGIIPARTAGHGDLWRARIDVSELERRLGEAHRPFHDALQKGLDLVLAAHGTALLLDCHSMPPRRGQAELVIGNRYGSSAAQWVADEAARIARSIGWTVALNEPYAGGHVVERHGDPANGVHALQLEIDRRCYCGPDLRTPGPGFDRATRLIAELASRLGEILARPQAVAAE
jgi:N-formylglutamate amidohydrolase